MPEAQSANRTQVNSTSSDLTFITNEPGHALGDRFDVLLTKDTRHFDCLVAYAVESRSHYSPVMRFVLASRDLREFEAQRMCYRSSIDGWLTLDCGNLRDMAKKYIPYVGHESFFELFAWPCPPRPR